MGSIAIRLDGPNVQTQAFTIDWFMVDMAQQLRLTLSNSALTNHTIDAAEPGTFSSATLSCWLSHDDLVKLVIGINATVDDIPDLVSVNRDKSVWTTLTGLLTTPNAAFAIVTP